MSVRKCLDPVEVGYKEPTGRAWEVFKSIPELHKWHHYAEIYDELLVDMVGRDIKVLEIGVWQGGSLRGWEQYFGPDSTIVGIDINDQTFGEFGDRTHIRIGSQSDEAFLQSVIDEFGTFDLIIDDGSHMVTDQKISLLYLFKHALRPEGLYVVEDTHTSFLKTFVDSPRTFIGTCHQVVDLIHAEYWNHAADFAKFSEPVEGRGIVTMEYFEAWVHSVQFFDSIIALKKRLRGFQVSDSTCVRGDNV